MLYKEYIKVEPDFSPVFSASNDITDSNKWKSFYPHPIFVRILSTTIDMLEKSSGTKNKPIWMNGTYGTGKTFASFVIKHILEDDEQSVRAYLEPANLSQEWIRLSGIRKKGKILVVHQSASAGINSQNKLFSTIVESVKKALRDKGYKYFGSISMLEKVLATLKDPDPTFNFAAAFRKYRSRFWEYHAPESIINDLENLGEEEKLDLLDTIISVAESESYNWSMSVQDVINWLRDVREKNDIYAIVFIWDEFTEYFRNNVNNITGLQEILQATAITNFYLFLITHGNPEQLITDSAQRKIMEARVHVEHIEFAENTALQLMGQALNIEPDMLDEWKKICNDLLDMVQNNAIKHIINRDNSVKIDDFRKLLPIHPYAAYLLKILSQNVSSNQRTMFQFLSADYELSNEIQTNFKWFIENFSFDISGWNFLTVDYLWDYFFRLDNADLSTTFKDAIAYYNNVANVCQNENQARILKATLILFCLQSTVKTSPGSTGASSLLQATFNNICACFAGTPCENEIRPTINFFIAKRIISAIEETDGTHYIMATTPIDSEQLKKVREQFEKDYGFDAIIKDEFYGVAKTFKPTGYMKTRLEIQIISPTKFLSDNQINFSLEENQILLFYLFVANEEEQGRVNQTLQKIYENFPERCIVADFSATPLTKERYESFVDHKSHDIYFRNIPNNREQSKTYAKWAADIIQEWNNSLSCSKVRVYTAFNEFAQVSTGRNFLYHIESINSDIYEFGLETVVKNDKIFDIQGFKEIVAKYALGLLPIAGSYSYLKNLEVKFKEIGGRTDENYWLSQPLNSISKMKKCVEEIIQRGFEKKSAASLLDIWKELKKPPFGLMKCTGSVYIFAALMKEYADNIYYVRDINNNTQPLNGEKLASLIYGTTKELSGVLNNYLVKQTPEHIKFCKITGKIFNLSHDKINSIDDVVKNIKILLTQKNFPIWSLKYYVEKEFDTSTNLQTILQFFNLINELINPQTVNSRELPKIADDIYILYRDNPAVVDELKNIVRDENFRSGMAIYIAQYKPELIEIAAKLNVAETEYLTRLNEKISADSSYLWKVDDFNKQIDNIFYELRLTDALNKILSEPQKNYFKAQQELSRKLNRIKIPRSVVEEFYPDLKNIFKIFDSIQKNSVKNFEMAANQIEIFSEKFRIFFENQLDNFAHFVKKYVENNADEATIEILYRDEESGTFSKPKDDFIAGLKQRLKILRRKEIIVQFFNAWKNVTGTESPADWSQKNEIPILCLFPDSLGEAQLYFDALNKNSQLPSDKIDKGLKFIKNGYLTRLNNKAQCETDFVKYFCENYDLALDVHELRDILRKSAGSDVYSWYAKKFQCMAAIKKSADENYKKNLVEEVRKTVQELTAEDAKKYLEELIEKDTLLGIRVLKNSRGGRNDYVQRP